MNRRHVDGLGGNSDGVVSPAFGCTTLMVRDSDEASSVGVSSAESSGCELAFALSSRFGATRAAGLFLVAPGHDLLTRYPLTIGLCSTLVKAINTGGGSVLHSPAFASGWGASIQGLKSIASVVIADPTPYACLGRSPLAGFASGAVACQ